LKEYGWIIESDKSYTSYAFIYVHNGFPPAKSLIRYLYNIISLNVSRGTSKIMGCSLVKRDNLFHLYQVLEWDQNHQLILTLAFQYN
jgi:hypothetical protein